MNLKFFRRSLLLTACLCLSLSVGNSVAGPNETSVADKPETLAAIRSGAQLERARKWIDAIEHYQKALENWPENKKLTYGLRRSKIHFAIDRRYSDASYEQSLIRLSRSDALDLFDEILSKIRSSYVDPISTTSYVAHGTESLYLALGNDKFIKRNLSGVHSRRIQYIRTVLREKFWNKPIRQQIQARDTVNEVCNLAVDQLGISPTAVILEYTFGGCNALDDYSSYLTPNRLEDLYGNIEGEFVGLGIEMKAEVDKGLLLIDVLPNSPAELGGLQSGDYIVSVDQQDCRRLSADDAARLLRGPSGSRVALDVERPDTNQHLQFQLQRQAVLVKSIPQATLISGSDRVGYIKMTGFQKSTPDELDAALNKLQQQNMRALIWDLRGNPGGLLTAAVEVLDRFIPEGTLVSTRGRTSDQNWTYSAHRIGTLNVPLILLVDGESASASEIVAGAIHDHRRGKIVGRKTYGKWSVQSIFPSSRGTGLRLTTARFYSPKGTTLGKIGFKPDIVVDAPKTKTSFYRGLTPAELAADRDVQSALNILRAQYSLK